MAYTPDIVLVDRDDLPILIGEVKAPGKIDPRSLVRGIAQLRTARARMRGGDGIRYGLLADPSTIALVDLDGDDSTTVWSAKTADILRPYAPDFPGNTGVGDRVFHWYLEGMIGSWLRDLAYHWKQLENSPGADIFNQLGLLDRMQGGWAGSLDRMNAESIESEASLGPDLVR